MKPIELKASGNTSVISNCPYCKRLITFTYYSGKDYGAFRCEFCGAYGELSATENGFFVQGSRK